MDQTGPRQRGYMAAGFAALARANGLLCAGPACPVSRSPTRWRRDVRRSYSVELIFLESAVDLCAVARAPLRSSSHLLM